MRSMDMDAIVRQVLSSRKYRYICRETVVRLSRAEAEKYKREKDVVKAVKGKLHLIHGSFLPEAAHRLAAAELAGLVKKKDADYNAASDRILQLHASTRERLSIYDHFYERVFAVTGRPQSILDLACGFNPFSIPRMGLETSIPYLATDINRLTIEILNHYFQLLNWPGQARLADLLVTAPVEPVDLAFAFKLLPVIEQQQAGSSRLLIQSLNCRYLVVTFAIRSLSGKAKSMLLQHEAFIKKQLEPLAETSSSFILGDELVYIMSKAPQREGDVENEV